MEKIINIKIQKLPEGVYLATSDQIQGLIAQGRTISETIEIARDVAKKLLESEGNNNNLRDSMSDVGDSIEYPLVVGI